MYLPGAHSLASSDTCKNNAREWDKVRGSRYSMRMKEKRGEEAGKQRTLGSNPLLLSFLFKDCGLWTLSRDLVLHN